MFCNQWGVKRSVTAARGRLAYAEDVATLLDNGGIHSAVWMWRSYRKSSWGFELVHEDESRRETEDVRLMNVLNKVWALAAPAAAAAVAPSAHPISSPPPPRPLPAPPPPSPPPPPPPPPTPPQAAEAARLGGRKHCTPAAEAGANCFETRCCVVAADAAAAAAADAAADASATCYVKFPGLAVCRPSDGGCPAGWACSFDAVGAPSLPPLPPPPPPPPPPPRPPRPPSPHSPPPPPPPPAATAAVALHQVLAGLPPLLADLPPPVLVGAPAILLLVAVALLWRCARRRDAGFAKLAPAAADDVAASDAPEGFPIGADDDANRDDATLVPSILSERNIREVGARERRALLREGIDVGRGAPLQPYPESSVGPHHFDGRDPGQDAPLERDAPRASRRDERRRGGRRSREPARLVLNARR